MRIPVGKVSRARRDGFFAVDVLDLCFQITEARPGLCRAPGDRGDAAELGGYQLTGNLDMQAEPDPINVTAIKITAESVTLDFNGSRSKAPSAARRSAS